MKLVTNPLMKRLMALRYLRDELKQLKYISVKGQKRLLDLENDIRLLEEQCSVPEYREIA